MSEYGDEGEAERREPAPQGPPVPVTSGKIAKALEIRKSTAKAREGKPLAFPTSRRHP